MVHGRCLTLRLRGGARNSEMPDQIVLGDHLRTIHVQGLMKENGEEKQDSGICHVISSTTKGLNIHR